MEIQQLLQVLVFAVLKINIIHMHKQKNKKGKPQGMALLLVMTVIVVVLSTIAVGVTLLLNNLDENKGRENTEQALASAHAGIEKVKGYYTNNPNFFDSCTVNDCVDFINHRCTACSNAAATYTDGGRSYQVKVTNLNIYGNPAQLQNIGLLATGYNGLYRQTVRDAIPAFVCGHPTKGLVSDQDNFQYQTVQIDSQCWFAENLKTRRKRDGTCINSGPEFVAPDCVTQGGDGGEKDSARDCMHSTGSMKRGKDHDCEDGYTLYRWDGAMNEDPGDPRGICPSGWHIPTVADQGRLIDAGFTGTDLQVGGASGFNAILTGDRELDGETFLYRDDWDCFWVSEEYDKDNAPYFCVQYKEDTIFTFTDSKNYSIAVRCLKDS